MELLRAHNLNSSPIELSPLLTLNEAARELRCSRSLLYKIRRGGIGGLPPLPLFRIGRKTFIRTCQLQAWIRTLEDVERESAYATGNFGLRDDQREAIAGA